MPDNLLNEWRDHAKHSQHPGDVLEVSLLFTSARIARVIAEEVAEERMKQGKLSESDMAAIRARFPR